MWARVAHSEASNFELETSNEKVKKGAVIVVVDKAGIAATIITLLVQQKQKAAVWGQCCRQSLRYSGAQYNRAIPREALRF